MIGRALMLVATLVTAAACGDDDAPSWQVVHRGLPGALVSVWGTSATDVWAVGGDPGGGAGPEVLHFDGAAWTRLATGQAGDLWWVFGFAGGPVYLGGAGGMILRYQGGAFERMTTPGSDTVFGIWGASPDELWAVGGATGGSQGAFAWRLDGDAWVAAPGFPAELADTDVMWKIFGRSAADAWLVGTSGKTVRWDGAAFTVENTGVGESLFTVHARADRYAAVGGFGTGLILEHDGAGWRSVGPEGALPMIGVHLTDDGGFAVGQYGAVARRDDAGWQLEDTGMVLDESLHAVWVDPDGGVWAAGGQVLSFPLIRGILLHRGQPVPTGGL